MGFYTNSPLSHGGPSQWFVDFEQAQLLARRPKILAQLCSLYTDKSKTRLNMLCNWLFIIPTHSYENIPFHSVFFFPEKKKTTYFDNIILVNIQNM